MAREQLFDFKHDGNTIWVFTGESSSDVYYQVNQGVSRSAGLKYRADKGYFVRSSGSILLFKDAQSYIRGLL